MKKYIKPIVDCYEFETISLFAGSPSSQVGGSLEDGGSVEEGDEVLGRENNHNPNLWDSGW